MKRRKFVSVFLIFILCTLGLFRLGMGQAAAADALDNWHVRKENTSAYGVGYGDGVFAAVGDAGEILTSADGVIWTSRSSGTTEDLAAVAYGNGKYVAVGDNGVILISADGGATWEEKNFTLDVSLWGIAYGNGKYVAVGENWNTDTGAIMTSQDGESWNLKNFGADVVFSGLAYGDGKFVAVGENWYTYAGTIATSSDGVTWIAQSSGPDEALYGVAYGKGSFIATGYTANGGGRIISSQDGGATWQVRASGLSGYVFLNGIAYGGGIFTVAGENFESWITRTGLALTSPDGATWTLRTTVAQQGALLSVAYGQGTFVAVTSDGTIIQSDSSRGDVNNDQRTNLLDLILYLQVLSGEHPPEVRPDYHLSGTDPDGDGRIGLSDAVFILQKVSGLR